MKKLLLLLLSLLLITPSVFGEDYPPKGGRDKYPIYWYLHRHGERLMKELNTRKFFRLHGWSCEYLAEIDKEGNVKTLKLTIPQNKLYDKSIKKIIETTKAEPFGDEIKEEKLVVAIFLSYGDWGEIVSVTFGPNWGTDEKIYAIYVKSNR